MMMPRTLAYLSPDGWKGTGSLAQTMEKRQALLLSDLRRFGLASIVMLGSARRLEFE